MTQEDLSKKLNDLFQSKQSHIVIIPGKPGAGKTTFLKQWMKDKTAIYFRSDLQHDRIQIPRFSKAVQAHFNQTQPEYPNWDAFFNNVFTLAGKKKKMLIILDEFPKLLKSNRTFLVTIEKLWEKLAKKYPIMLIMAGSSLPEMNYTHLRLTGLQSNNPSVALVPFLPMNFAEFKDRFTSLSFEDAVALYGITGGTERFVQRINPHHTLEQNVRSFFDHRNFYDFDPKYLFHYDFHDPTTYFSILQILARNEKKIGVIAKCLDLKTHNLTSFLDRLRDLKVIERILPPTDENPVISRKGRYHIVDAFHRFWFRYIYPHQDILSVDNIDYVWDYFMEKFNLHMKETIIDIISEKFQTNPLFPIKNIGPWWNKNKNMDLIITGQNDVILCDISYNNGPVRYSAYEKLNQMKEVMEIPRRIKKFHYLFFSNEGFDPDFVHAIRRKKKIYLWSMDDIK